MIACLPSTRTQWARLLTAAALGISVAEEVRATSADWPANPLVNSAICTAPNVQSQPAIATDGSGGAIIVWTDARTGGVADIYAGRVLASGMLDPAWPPNGRAVCTAAGTQSAPGSAPDGSGGVVVAWQDFRSGAASDIYAGRLRGDGTLDPAWPSDGLLVCAADSSQLLPSVVSDGAGGAYILWSDLRNRVDRDVYVHHVLSSGSMDSTWPANGLPVCAAAGNQFNPSMVVGADGALLVAWGDLRSGESDIYVQRVLPQGVVDPGWPSNGLAVCSASGAQQIPVIVRDGDAGAFIAWQDYRFGSSDVYATRVRADGTLDPTWTAQGISVCGAVGDQTALRMVETVAGEAILAWMDGRSSALDIFAHRLQGSGLDPAWPVNGLAICSITGDQRNPALSTDGVGGAIVGWEDSRSGAADIYAIHVLANGSLDSNWPIGGAPISTAAGSQQVVRMLADGSGGAILCWQDGRSGATDIYAQRVQANGSLGGTVVDVPSTSSRELSIQRLRPNPWRGGTLTVEFSSGARGAVTIEILDVAGRREFMLSLGEIPPGKQSVSFSLPRSARRDEVFAVRIRQGGESHVRKVVVAN